MVRSMEKVFIMLGEFGERLLMSERERAKGEGKEGERDVDA